MSSLFNALSGGLTRFIYAWLMPSATVVTVFAVFVLPYAPDAVAAYAPGGTKRIEGGLMFVLAVVGLPAVFAYASLPIYRFVEGYSMPSWLARPLLRRQLRAWYRMHETFRRTAGAAPNWQLRLEEIDSYPKEPQDVLPTRLGNALRAMEHYGGRTFGLDSQTLWYELQAVASDKLRRDTEDARAGVDFFISAVVHLAILVIVAGGVFAWSHSAAPGVVALLSAIAIPIGYKQAVRNVGEWGASVQALVNLGRLPLCAELGFRMPRTFAAEREMWESVVDMISYGPGQDYLRVLDPRRAR